jgi:hypothetical protein
LVRDGDFGRLQPRIDANGIRIPQQFQRPLMIPYMREEPASTSQRVAIVLGKTHRSVHQANGLLLLAAQRIQARELNGGDCVARLVS